jgi:hypothetical protein
MEGAMDEADLVRMTDVLASSDVDLTRFFAVYDCLSAAGFTRDEIYSSAGDALERVCARRGPEGEHSGQLVGGSVGRRAILPLVAGAMFFSPLQSPPRVPAHVSITLDRARAIWGGFTAEDILWLESKFRARAERNLGISSAA